MVKSAERRTRKYEESVSGERVGRAVSDLKPLMVEQQKTYFPKIAMLEDKVKALCEAQGVSTLQVRDYINVARKCFSINRKFTQATRDAEAQRIVTLWTNRGLNAALTSAVCNLSGCKTTAAPAPPTGELGISTLHELWRHRWHGSLLGCWGGGIMEAGNLFADQLAGVPFPIPRRMRWTQIGFHVNLLSDPPHHIRLGIYDSDGQGYPNSLLLETDPITIEAPQNYAVPIDITLDKALYFLAILLDKSYLSIFATYIFLSSLGSDIKQEMFGMVRPDYPYGNLPTTFPPTSDWTPYMFLLAMYLEENL